MCSNQLELRSQMIFDGWGTWIRKSGMPVSKNRCLPLGAYLNTAAVNRNSKKYGWGTRDSESVGMPVSKPVPLPLGDTLTTLMNNDRIDE